jgi:uncharacterized metal-binding protein YceD (DUF177 family)
MSLSRVYNLNKLGQLGDEITLDADEAERAALAKSADVLDVPKFAARIVLKKSGANSFQIHYDLAAEIVQACVVTLEPLVARIVKDFERELHYTPNLRRAAGETEIVIAPCDDELPEEIDSPHYDLAVPLMEEFLLAIDPYPRAPGVEFQPPEGMTDKPESPFAALKGLKSGG